VALPGVVALVGALGVTTGGGVPTAWVTGADVTGAETGGVGVGIGGGGAAVGLLTTGAFASALG
jgi:hypothetical protein